MNDIEQFSRKTKKHPAGNNSTVHARPPRVYILSHRNLKRDLARCVGYEFEDVICQIDDVEMLAPTAHKLFKFTEKIANQLARSSIRTSTNPGVSGSKLCGTYELFMMFCQNPRDLLTLNALKGWRQHCKKAVCWLEELWAADLRNLQGYLKLLSQFDCIVLGCIGTIQYLQKALKQPCFYMPAGVDAIRFCPYPNPPDRCVDVYSMGRRSPVIHQSLLKMAERKQIFYMYDTMHAAGTLYPNQHRKLIANIAKRSRYFISYPAKINQPFETHGQQEIGPRYFEGAAAGTVMLGQAPANPGFQEYFDWPNVVITVPFDDPNITKILDELDTQPRWLRQIRRDNVTNCLLRHDWAYRYKTILDAIELQPKPALNARLEHLNELAEQVKKDS
jgi:hypothetical protein